MRNSTILVVDNDTSTADQIKTALQNTNFTVEAASPSEALEKTQEIQPNLIVLDLSAPKGNGTQILSQLRAEGEHQSGAAIVVLVGRDMEEEAMAAIETGADDFVIRPFNARELSVRIQLALRHGVRKEPARGVALRAGPIFLNVERREVLRLEENGEMKPIPLTKREFALLRALMARKNQMMTRAQLVLEAFGPHAEVEPGNLGAYIHRLREKVEPKPGNPRYLVTDRGQGFKMID